MSKATERRTVTNQEDVKDRDEYIEKYFPVARVSTLSLEDDFLKHEPESNAQRKFKRMFIEAIKSGLSDFRVQRMDPSLDGKGSLCYKTGMEPVVGKSANWWKKKAKEFMPEKESRLGTTKEKNAFLGLLIRYLIEELGYTTSDAWKAVCDQSKNLDHYRDSKDAKHNFVFTGSEKIGDWYDLFNTYKITIDDETHGFSLVGIFCNGYGCYSMEEVVAFCKPDVVYDDSTGWIVLPV
ncbi:MAG: hypothetical protein IJE05_05650 [Clostridia bacterium]|nr:hypothetical protein [Clostridia bacterium]